MHTSYPLQHIRTGMLRTSEIQILIVRFSGICPVRPAATFRQKVAARGFSKIEKPFSTFWSVFRFHCLASIHYTIFSACIEKKLLPLSNRCTQRTNGIHRPAALPIGRGSTGAKAVFSVLFSADSATMSMSSDKQKREWR